MAVCDILGGKNPLSAELTSSMADESGDFPVLLILTWENDPLHKTKRNPNKGRKTLHI